MADIFYFSSPQTALSFKHRGDVKSKSSSYRRRRNTKMDFPLQHACVARLEEPTFCSSAFASLIPHYGFPAITSLSLTSQQDVAAPRRSTEDCDTNCDDIAEASPIAKLEGASAPQVSSPSDDSSLSGSYRPTSSRHPRPDSGDTWEEEEARRLRFALDDPDQDEASSQQPAQTSVSGNETDEPAGTTPSYEHSDDEALGDYFAYGDHFTRGIETTRSFLAETRLHGSVLDYDALAVDDPRRSYSYADFMDSWYPAALKKQQIPFVDHDSASLLRRVKPNDIRRDEIRESGADMQGLQWSHCKCTREQALEARKQMHPSQRNSVKHQTGSERSHCVSELHYHFKAFVRSHLGHVSHYQLRNVLTASSRNDIFYSTGNKVMQASLASSSIRNTVMDLSKPWNSASCFRITTLCTSFNDFASAYRSDNVLFAGGFFGEYAILNLMSDGNRTPVVGFVTHDYNGLVTHVDSYSARHSGSLRAAFCSNDRRIRIMDANTARFIDTFTYDSAVNCSASSPDGRLRVLVGDSCETLITDAERGNILLTLNEHIDHGFACAWSIDGRYIATGAQDSKVIMWDCRNWSTPLETLHCNMSSARSLHFTGDNALIVGEDDDVVSIYNTSNFEIRQDIRFFGSIAGIAVLDGGAEIVIANADETVGGLLSFQRTPQGLNCGTYGEKVNNNVINVEMNLRNRAQRSRGGSLCAYVSSVVV